MKLIKIGKEESRNEFDNNSYLPGIYQVVRENAVIRTYSNGLSFKHILGDERKRYQVAISNRLRELGIESARICRTHAPKVMSLFTRWNALEKKHNEGDPGEITSLYGELRSLANLTGIPSAKLTAEELYNALKKEFHFQNPKFMAAWCASFCNNRSNLGQSSFLRLVASGRGYLDAVEKIQWLLALFKEEPEEFLSFLMFGRAPWTEKRFLRRYRCSFVWARNFIVGIYNKFARSLQTAKIVPPKASLLSGTDILRVIEKFLSEVEKTREEMEEKGRDITRIKSFLTSLDKVKTNPSLLTKWFASQDFRFTWKSLKTYATSVRGVSFSVLRAVIIRACLHQKAWEHVIERCSQMFTPEHTLKKPFHERTSLMPLPIDLVMGRKYVIYRPGNAKKMRELLLKDGSIWFEIPKVRINGAYKKVKTRWYAPKKVVRALERGAKIRLFRFNMPRGPGKTVKVDLMLSGKEELFFGQAHLYRPPNKVLEEASFQKDHSASKSIAGLDINRLSEHVITASLDLNLKSVLNPLLAKWNALETTIAMIQRKIDTTTYWRQRLKLTTELGLLHRRRSHLRKDMLVRARTCLGKKLVESHVEFVALEASLQKDTKDKRGALAKAISSMPDNITLVIRELGAVNSLLNRNLKLVLVRKEGTSRFHYECGGVINRTGDLGACRSCGELINIHENAAENIEERATNLVNEYYAHQLTGGTPSTA
jgi:hypothetical protein